MCTTRGETETRVNHLNIHAMEKAFMCAQRTGEGGCLRLHEPNQNIHSSQMQKTRTPRNELMRKGISISSKMVASFGRRKSNAVFINF